MSKQWCRYSRSFVWVQTQLKYLDIWCRCPCREGPDDRRQHLNLEDTDTARHFLQHANHYTKLNRLIDSSVIDTGSMIYEDLIPELVELEQTPRGILSDDVMILPIWYLMSAWDIKMKKRLYHVTRITDRLSDVVTHRRSQRVFCIVWRHLILCILAS